MAGTPGHDASRPVRQGGRRGSRRRPALVRRGQAVSAGRSGRLAGLVSLAFLAAACARALHEPHPITDPTGGPPVTDEADMRDLVARAAALFAEREVERAQEAARLYQRVAAAKNTSLEAIVGLARVEVWLTDHLADAAARQAAAQIAVEAAQACAARAPSDPECSYWMGA